MSNSILNRFSCKSKRSPSLDEYDEMDEPVRITKPRRPTFELVPCPDCDGQGSTYGLAPHTHEGLTENPISFIGSTRIEPKKNWPKNFHEDCECPGMGVWTCIRCNGEGRVEVKK